MANLNINSIVSQEMGRIGLNTRSVAGAVGDQVVDEGIKAVFRTLVASMAAGGIDSTSGVLTAFSHALSMLGRYPIAGRLVTETVESLQQQGVLTKKWDVVAHAVVGAGEGLHNALDSGSARPMDIFKLVHEKLPESAQQEVKATVGMSRKDAHDLLNGLKANEQQKRAFKALYLLVFLDTQLDAVELPGTRDMWVHITLALRMGGKEVLEELPEIRVNHINNLERVIKIYHELMDPNLTDPQFKRKLGVLRRLQGGALMTYAKFTGFIGTCEAIAKHMGTLGALSSIPDKVSDTLDDLNTFEMRLRAKRALHQTGDITWEWLKKAGPALADGGFTSVVWISWGFVYLNFAWLAFVLLGALGFFAVGFGAPVVVLWIVAWMGYYYLTNSKLNQLAAGEVVEMPNHWLRDRLRKWWDAVELPSWLAWLKKLFPPKSVEEDEDNDEAPEGKPTDPAENQDPVEEEVAELPVPNPVWARIRRANRAGVILGAIAWPIFLILSLLYNGWGWSPVDHYQFWATTTYVGVLIFLVSFLWAAILIEFSLKLAILLGNGVLTTGGGIFAKAADWFMEDVLKRSGDAAKLKDSLKIEMRKATPAERPMMAITQLFSARGGLIAAIIAIYVAFNNMAIVFMTLGVEVDKYLLRVLTGMVVVSASFIVLALLLWVLIVMLRVAYASAFLDDFGGKPFVWKFKKARNYAQLVEFGLTVPVTIAIGVITMGTVGLHKGKAVTAHYESPSAKYAYYDSNDCDTLF